ncbi:TetR/AcrR family transcriptional regulator [Streptomyces albidoflavus]|uniref:TetR/AcrR family transcriptional regulator n=1 Tax=Streptomyces albidoflavus TaxID=1886 RepID=UPI000FEFD295|nr:TetR/AcrR family transcriptional regulator [Streptomyces albidoflavus]RWZ74608.1 TetR/AcrR family transcriptional regulator [Streptomyces albidoflavus]
MTSRREPTSRRDRPAKPALSRQWIVAAALGIMREEGLEKVTMRRLAQELDTGPASLYVYVANTAALHAAVLDALLGDVDLSGDDEGGDWREQLRAVLRSYTLVLFAYPQLARSALVARPSGENYLRLVERVLALLSRGGAGREQAAWGVDTLLQSATATAAEQATRERDPAATDEWNATVQALGAASEATHPAISAHMPALVGGSPDERFRWGFDVLVNGILATPAPASAE